MKQGRGSKLIFMLEKLEKKLKRNMKIVETGTIRNDSERHHLGDGWSTYYIAQFVRNSADRHDHEFISIDLKTDVAEAFLRREGMEHQVKLVQDNSNNALPKIEGPLDFVYLDSANNADQIFNEFELVQPKLLDTSVVVVDDIKTNKPKKLLPWLEENKIPYKIEGRHLIFQPGFK